MKITWFILIISIYIAFTNFNAIAISFSNTGIVICSGDGDIFSELLGILSQIKLGSWNQLNNINKLPVIVAHCNELSPDSIKILSYNELFGNVTVINICGDHSINVDHNKLKSFFCKPLSILHSPFQNTILMDTDVIWFDDPLNILSSQGFIDTGALFFRDRWTQTRNTLTLTAGTHNANNLYRYLESIVERLNFANKNNFVLNKTDLVLKNAFWRHFVNNGELTLDHLQDSSLLLIDSSRHKITLQAIKIMLKDFHIGYGDKEMYWLACTAANENYAFEPYLAGSFGDCGALIHFNPNISNNVKPLYINAEYLIDTKKIKKIGDFTQTNNQITKPKIMDEINTPIKVLTKWKNMEHGFYPCGNCDLYGCIDTDNYIINEIKRRQEIILNIQILRNNNSFFINHIKTVIYNAYNIKN